MKRLLTALAAGSLLGSAPPSTAATPIFELSARAREHSITAERSAARYVPSLVRARSISYEIEATLGQVVPHESSSEPPQSALVLSASPNPFSMATHLSADLPTSAQVSLCVYDVLGRRVATLADGVFPQGHHVIDWNVSGDARRPLGNGIYLAQLSVNGTVRTIRLGVIR